MMKKVTLFTIFLNSIFIFAQKFTIVDYFQLLPDTLKHGYELKLNKSIWESISCADYTINPIVDVKNGYIEIIDEGTGGGTTKLQVAMFRKIDGDAIIAVSYSFFDGFFNSSIYFLQYKSDVWKIISNQVLPSITYKLFMPKNYNIPAFSFTPYSIFFDLPRFGTTIKLKFHYEYMTMICNKIIAETDVQTQKNACIFVENIKNDSLNLFWNKEETKFYLK